MGELFISNFAYSWKKKHNHSSFTVATGSVLFFSNHFYFNCLESNIFSTYSIIGGLTLRLVEENNFRIVNLINMSQNNEIYIFINAQTIKEMIICNFNSCILQG